MEEIPKIIEIHKDNQKFELWRNKVSDILEAAFGRSSSEWDKFVRAVGASINSGTEIEYQQEYNRRLYDFETALKSIIQKYELLGIEEKTQQKDTVKSPIQLFDAMQFHKKVVKASRKLFEDKHYAQAIFEAFKVVENFVRERSGLSSYGKNLMATAFNEENPIIKVPEAGYFDKDVQEGFKFLFMGATQGIRNPKAHKEIVQNDPFITLEYLGFASFLLKRIDYWEADVS